jgi:hypothetical protein
MLCLDNTHEFTHTHLTYALAGARIEPVAAGGL